MSAAEVSARLAALHESVSREMNQITLERDSYSARLRTAEARLQRMRAALASEAELRSTLLKLLEAAKSDDPDVHDERAQHASELFVVQALVARHERELANATAQLDEANHANDELLKIASQRAQRIAELERQQLLRSEALQPQPPPQPQPQPQLLHHAPHAYPSTPSKGHKSSRSHRSSSPRSPRSRRSAADVNAGSTGTVKKGSALQRFGAPPPLPVAEEAPPLLPQTVPAMPPPLPVVNDEAAELQQTVMAQRDQIRLLQSALARREQDREKLAQLERVVDRLALEVATERELRRELEQANERIVRLRSIVQQQQQQQQSEPRLFDSAVSLIDSEEQERLSTLPRIDAAAVAAAGAADPVYSLPAAITERTLVALTRVVLEKSARAVDDSDADAEEKGVLPCASLRASSDGGADAPEGSQTLSHIKELMALLRSPP
jgi:hypothetical protein